MRIDRDIRKILRPSFFMGHPLYCGPRASVSFDFPNPAFFLKISSLHNLSTGQISSPSNVLSLRYECYQNRSKSANFADKVLSKTAISPSENNIFQTVCSDVHKTLASTRSIYNESNGKTSIEQSLWVSVVTYGQWLICIL